MKETTRSQERAQRKRPRSSPHKCHYHPHRVRRLWWSRPRVVMMMCLLTLCSLPSTTRAVQTPVMTPSSSSSSERELQVNHNNNDHPPNRINAPNRSREQKKESSSSTSSTTTTTTTNNKNTKDLVSSKTKENKPAPFPTPQNTNERQPSKTMVVSESQRSAADNSNSNHYNNNHKLRAKHDDDDNDDDDDDDSSRAVEENFMKWCQEVLGIETILEIQTFEYYDYMQAMPQEDWNDDNHNAAPYQEYPLIPVRGLAAARDITAGQVVIRIPLDALLSVATTIDADPVLTTVMGPAARAAHGWSATATDDTSALLEMPLLAVALLYHAGQTNHSPLSPYLQMLQATPVDRMPFLWSPSRLRNEASQGVRTVARGIQRDMNDMYDAVVPVLVEQYPHIFGPPSRNENEEEDNEWMFSREKFQWAFAMVTTRHWQLPIEDYHGSSATVMKEETDGTNTNNMLFEDSPEDAGLPPASTPTDSWVEEHSVDLDDGNIPVRAQGGVLMDHSFLAPFADLLNFGPPCTRGRYDSATHSFEITALCDFKKGQEVTFYYSDECDHVVSEKVVCLAVCIIPLFY